MQLEECLLHFRISNHTLAIVCAKLSNFQFRKSDIHFIVAVQKMLIVALCTS